jgi:hypothetical protein
MLRGKTGKDLAYPASILRVDDAGLRKSIWSPFSLGESRLRVNEKMTGTSQFHSQKVK